MYVHPGLDGHTAHLLGADWTHFNAHGSWPRQQRIVMYGANSTHISRPVLITLMLKELVNPDVLVPVSTMQTQNWLCRMLQHACTLPTPAVAHRVLLEGLAFGQDTTTHMTWVSP